MRGLAAAQGSAQQAGGVQRSQGSLGRGSPGRACGFVPENWEALRVLTRSMASFVHKN